MIGYIGIDEVGRGPLAGPITICAVFINDVSTASELLFKDGIKDSKKLNAKSRDKAFETIRKNKELFKYVLHSVSARQIDAKGINHSATRSVDYCLLKMEKNGINIRKSVIRMDAGLKSSILGIEYMSYVKGDEKYEEIAIASILAKVSRDRYMTRLSKEYPHYAWERNSGYGTKEHFSGMRGYGLTKYHRKSFIKNLI